MFWRYPSSDVFKKGGNMFNIWKNKPGLFDYKMHWHCHDWFFPLSLERWNILLANTIEVYVMWCDTILHWSPHPLSIEYNNAIRWATIQVPCMGSKSVRWSTISRHSILQKRWKVYSSVPFYAPVPEDSRPVSVSQPVLSSDFQRLGLGD